MTSTRSFVAGLTARALADDPYGSYARMRAEQPIAYLPHLDQWFITRYDHIKAALDDPGRFTNAGTTSEVIYTCGSESVSSIEGPRHDRYRGGLEITLRPRAVEARAREFLTPVITTLLETLSQTGEEEVDLVAGYFERLSVLALRNLLGVPGVDEVMSREWFRGLSLGVGNVGGDPSVREYALGVSRQIDERVSSYIVALEDEPDGSLVSYLLERAVGTSAADRAADILPTIKIAIGAGQQEPGHGAATVLAGILGDPRVHRAIADDPDGLLPVAVEEGLRWVPPIQIVGRRTLAPVTLGGQPIEAGAFVTLVLASGNRDEHVFGADADHFRLHRRRQSHLSFGFGQHFCVGNYFGRSLIKSGIRRLLETFPDLRLARPVTFEGLMFRTPPELWVTLGSR
jgi:cytochrome P450